MTFDGKVTLITGAASGIGKATAIHFARLGAKLALADRNENDLQNTGRECQQISKWKPLLIKAELTNEQDVQNVLDETINCFSCLDVLINNAGIMFVGSIETTKLEDFDRIFDTNVRAVFHLTSLAVPYLIKSKGVIVNVSSVHGIRSFPESVAYDMSKSAIDQMTRCVALELAGKGIRVNSVNPGYVVTNIIEKNCSNMTREDIENLRKKFANSCPLGRLAQPAEIAAAIAFLCSEGASFITGINLAVDGGLQDVCVLK